MKFRALTADETECRIAQVKQNYVQLLIYKNARVDMEILDETVRSANWQREHYECKGNLFCKVGINVNCDNPEKEPLWVWKADCGAESYTEKEKGESSDSFKRSCFCWGIGRELYTAPNIYIYSDNCNIEATKRTDKYGNPVYTCRDIFKVGEMKVDNGRIVVLQIVKYDRQSRTWVLVYDFKRAI